MKIAIVGYGHVGKAMKELFQHAIIYDEPLGIGNRNDVNNCDVAFVCVPTPEGAQGKCDTSIVERVIEWIESEVIVLRSTVSVGFTSLMREKYKKRIVFQPEYYGETVGHPFTEIKNQGWLSFGGENQDINIVIEAYKTVINSNVRINIADSNTVELAKYMENAYLATKVVFCNEIYDLAKKLGIDYNVVREIWLSDPRIGYSHTFVYPDNRGYGGHCLPKDMNALISIGEEVNADMTFLKGVKSKNEMWKGNQNE